MVATSCPYDVPGMPGVLMSCPCDVHGDVYGDVLGQHGKGHCRETTCYNLNQERSVHCLCH